MAEADVPDHFREEREECGEDVGDGEVQNEEVHARHLRPANRRRGETVKQISA